MGVFIVWMGVFIVLNGVIIYLNARGRAMLGNTETVRFLLIPLFFFFALDIIAEENADAVVFEYIESHDYEGLVSDVISGIVDPAYVFPGGVNLVEALVTIGATKSAIQLLDLYWPLLKFTSLKVLTASCINNRYDVMAALFERGALNRPKSKEVLHKCMNFAVSEVNAQQVKLLLKNGANPSALDVNDVQLIDVVREKIHALEVILQLMEQYQR